MTPGAVVLRSERLVLRRFTHADAAFVCELLNEPGWLRWIGDRNVRTPEDALGYLDRTLLAQYERLGYGFYRVELASTGEPVGMCGLVRRNGLEDSDIGFALLARYERNGYAREAAEAVVRHARDDFGLKRLVAITLPDNVASVALLEKLGMTRERTIRLPDGTEDLALFEMTLEP